MDQKDPKESNEPKKSNEPVESKELANGTPVGADKPSPPTAASNGNGHPSPPTRSSKPSLLLRLFSICVPCLSSQPVEIDLPTPVEKSTIRTDDDHPTTVAVRPPTPSKDPLPTPPTEAVVTPPPVTPPQDDVLLPPTTPPPQLLPLSETEGVTSGAVQPPGSTGDSPVQPDKSPTRDSVLPSSASAEADDSESTSFTEDEDLDGLDDLEDDEEKLIMDGGAGIPIGPDGVPKPLLPPLSPQLAGRKCLILDLDETLVHSSFKSIQQADYVVPVEIEYHWHNVYVIKRPGVDNFLKKMGEIYEIVVFTASLSKYADPVLDKLDIHQVVSHRLFRESCYNHKGNYVKDLSQLGRPTSDMIILDNSPASYIFHPNNAVPVSSWFNDPHDTELTDLVPFLADLASTDDVRGVLDGAR